MRFVVTGAAGFIGSHLAEELGARGHDVVGIDCLTDYYDPAEKEENARAVELERLDLAEDELDFRGFDGVFHLAGQPGVRSFGDGKYTPAVAEQHRLFLVGYGQVYGMVPR